MYTKHGHHIAGTPVDNPPDEVTRCGGGGICPECSKEIAATVVTSVHKVDPTPGVKPARAAVRPEIQAIAEREARRNRQLPDSEIQERFGSRAPTSAVSVREHSVSAKFIEMGKWLDSILPPGRTKAVALTELESCEMWAKKALEQMAPTIPS